MLKVRQILVSTLGLVVAGVGLTGCGQRGPLYLPTEPAAANRATLPDLIRPGSRTPNDTAVAPAAAASAPERTK
jgi:predicted small lipoprotein YifL